MESPVPKMRTSRGESLGRGKHDFYFCHIKVEVPIRQLIGKIMKVFGSRCLEFKSKVETRDVNLESLKPWYWKGMSRAKV